MIQRLREGIWRLGHLFERKKEKDLCCRDILKGAMRSVVVIKPENGIFSEAVFILSDDYLRRHGDTTQELLLEAQKAAEVYGCACSPMEKQYRRSRRLVGMLAIAIGVLLCAVWCIYGK